MSISYFQPCFARSKTTNKFNQVVNISCGFIYIALAYLAVRVKTSIKSTLLKSSALFLSCDISIRTGWDQYINYSQSHRRVWFVLFEFSWRPRASEWWVFGVTQPGTANPLHARQPTATPSGVSGPNYRERLHWHRDTLHVYNWICDVMS